MKLGENRDMVSAGKGHLAAPGGGNCWIFGPGDGREDRGVASCPFGFRRSTPDSPWTLFGPCHRVRGDSAKNSVFGVKSILLLYFDFFFSSIFLLYK